MGISTTPTAIAKLVQTAYDHFQAARAASSKPDRLTFDREMNAVQVSLEELVKVAKALLEQQPLAPGITLK